MILCLACQRQLLLSHIPFPCQPVSDWEDVPLRKDLGAERKPYSGALEPESRDMEVPTRGATCRCASVLQGFLHRNCVLSVPSKHRPHCCLSKHIDFWFEYGKLSSPFLNLFYFIRSISLIVFA